MSESSSVRKVKIYTIGFHSNPEAERLVLQLAAENHGMFVSRYAGISGAPASRRNGSRSGAFSCLQAEVSVSMRA